MKGMNDSPGLYHRSVGETSDLKLKRTTFLGVSGYLAWSHGKPMFLIIILAQCLVLASRRLDGERSYLGSIGCLATVTTQAGRMPQATLLDDTISSNAL